LESLQRSPDPLAGFKGSPSKRRQGNGRKGRERGKSPEWLSQKRGSTANAALKQLNCPQVDQLILIKIIKIVATRCHILRLKWTKFDFGWGSAPDPAIRGAL